MTFRTEHLAEGIDMIGGDCFAVLPTLAENSIDSCVTDPPYGLEFMGKKWDAPWKKGVGGISSARFNEKRFKDGSTARLPSFIGGTNPTCRNCGGLRSGSDTKKGQPACRCAAPKFDNVILPRMQAFQDWCEQWAHEVFRVLKPGAHLLAFGGTRTYHRMVFAIEDAGFEIRDPKSLDVSRAIDKVAGAEREVVGTRRVAIDRWTDEGRRRLENGECGSYDLAVESAATDAARQWSGFGTALKPACELICLARKPLSESTVAANVLRWGVGALNIDGCRVEHQTVNGGNLADNPHLRRANNHDVCDADGFVGNHGFRPNNSGRWPANVILSDDPEVQGAFPDAKSRGAYTDSQNSPATPKQIFGSKLGTNDRDNTYANDSGSAARFFYTAKADSDDRLGSKHPTVKPVDLIEYLVRLVTPPKGLVLDPFAGTGTTGEACIREGFRAILIEREEEYQDDIRRRMKLAMSGPGERAFESQKARNKDKPVDHGPLFGSGA